MKKSIPSADTKCVICGKEITQSEIVFGNYEFSKIKRGKTMFFHTECYKKEQETLKKG